MAEKRVITMTSICGFFKDCMNQMHRGENSYFSGNVVRVLFDSEVQPAVLRGEVKASMKNRSYSVEISLDVDDGIVAASCSCPRGQVICHHMAAVCIFGHHNISVTDKACTWNVPKINTEEKIQTIEDLYPKTRQYCAVKRLATEAEISRFLSRLEEPVGFSWLLKPEPTEECLSLTPSIEEIVFSKEYMESTDGSEFFEGKARITPDAIVRIAEATKGQHRNENWLVVRKHRLTASHFGAVISACAKDKFPPSLFKTLLGGYDFDHAKAIQWGRQNEKEALDMFRRGMEMEVVSTGLWLHECGYLGASPDGLIGDDALIEIKCPYSFREGDLEEILTNRQDYIIYKNENGMTKVNRNHPYWHQIQGQLHVTNRKLCYLMVWTPMKMEVIIIEKCDAWGENIEVLKKFYMEKYLPRLIN